MSCHGMRRSWPRPALLALALMLLAGPAQALGVKAAPDAELIRQGREHFQAARYQQAQDSLRQALGQVGFSARQRAEALTWLGLTYLGQGYPSYAFEALREARQIDPGYRPEVQAMPPEAWDLWQRAGDPAAAPPPAAPATPPSQGQYAAAPAPPPVPPGIQETPLSEPAPPTVPAPRAWLSQLLTAQGVKAGQPQGARAVFSPQQESIHLWFELHEVSAAFSLHAVWTYLEAPPQVVLKSSALARPGDTWGQFSCALRPGQAWPLGRYRVDVYIEDSLAGSAFFSVR